MLELKNQNLNVKLSIPVRYDEFRNDAAPNITLILLHGYGQTKERIYKSIGVHLINLAKRLIVLNGPFPIPYQDKEGDYKEGYAWYFHSYRQNFTVIPAENCEPFFDELISKLNLEGENVSLIGYSQGGYIMPLFAQKLKNLNQLIGISCGVSTHFKSWMINSKPCFNLIHSEEDNLSDVKQAEIQFNELNLDNKNCALYKLPGGHEMDQNKISIIKKLISQNGM